MDGSGDEQLTGDPVWRPPTGAPRPAPYDWHVERDYPRWPRSYDWEEAVAVVLGIAAVLVAIWLFMNIA